MVAFMEKNSYRQDEVRVIINYINNKEIQNMA